jgi:uncharacterized protein YcbX
MIETARIESIYRYPVKGLSPEPMDRVRLAAGETLPGDRRYAIENGPSGFDPVEPHYKAKTHYLMLMRNERLAALKTSLDAPTQVLAIDRPGHATIRGDLGSPQGRAAIEGFFAAFCADELRGPPRVLSAPPFSFSDVARKVVSIINLASVQSLAELIGSAVDPLRFRGNVYVTGWPAWSELDLVGSEIAIADARLKIVKRIVRCAATNVDPQTGARDLTIPETLLRSYGHADCGIYAEVVRGGEIAAGDQMALG